ncbi:MAG TPA: DUF1877 family protein [Gemmataceae bacterium]|nr:DUF1877 family protein [Gemmataceae bacterium]
MGVRAGFTEISPDIFEQVVAGAEPETTGGVHHSIDKAWNDFHLVFRSKGPPLNSAIAGDYRHSLSPHSLDEFCEGHHEYYVGFVSPHLVGEIAKVLVNITAADYKRWERELVGDQYNCGETFFPELKAAYAEAAARKSALMIVIC